MEVVSDSSPLIVLTKAGLLPAALGLFDAVLVPPAVERELAAGRPRPDAALLEDALDRGLLRRCPAPKALSVALPAGLAAGEREVLAAAMARRCAVLLDDRLAGRTAAMLGLPTLRTGRVLLLMVKTGELSPSGFEQRLHQLVSFGCRLSPADFAVLVKAARELAK